MITSLMGLFDYKDMIATISGGIILLLTQLIKTQ